MKKTSRRCRVFEVDDKENAPAADEVTKNKEDIACQKNESRLSMTLDALPQGVLVRNFFEQDQEVRYDELQIVEKYAAQPESVYRFDVGTEGDDPKLQEILELKTEKSEEEPAPKDRKVYLFDDDPEEEYQSAPVQTANETNESTDPSLIMRHRESARISDLSQLLIEIDLSSNAKEKIPPKNALVVDDIGEEEVQNGQLQQFMSGIECIRLMHEIPEGITALNEFLTKALPKGYALQCCLRRGTSDIGSNTYSLYVNNTFRHLLSAKKKILCTTSNYILSTNRQQIENEGPNYLGKCRSNFMGTVFNGYSQGGNPDRSSDRAAIRANIVTIKYETNFFGSNGPRKMEIFVPKPLELGDVDYIRPSTSDNGLDSEQYSASVQRLINKPPEWDQTIQAYVLNFNGRVTKASIKNFLLVDPVTNRTKLLFGRLAKNVFSLDIEHPFSVAQAMCIVLSSFDRKLACQ